MAHAIATRNGKAQMMYVGEKPWHGLGQYVGDNCVTWQSAIEAAGLDWTVSKKQLFGQLPGGVMVQVNAWGIFRDDDNEFVGAVGDRYEPIQNRDCFDFVDTLLGVENGAHYETAGALGNGYRIWTLARVPRGDFEVGSGDKHQMYLLFSTSHDGSLSCSAKLTDVRVVCNNTLNCALANEGQLLRIKHTANAQEKLQRAKAIMSTAVKDSRELAERMQVLAARKLNKESFLSILNRLFPMPKGENPNTGPRDRILTDVMERFEANDGNTFPEQRGTAYNLLNAVTNYVDHGRRSRVTNKRPGFDQSQARWESALLGSGALLKNKALEVVLEETESAETISTPIYSIPTGRNRTGAGTDSNADILANLYNLVEF